MQTKDTRRQLN